MALRCLGNPRRRQPKLLLRDSIWLRSVDSADKLPEKLKVAWYEIGGNVWCICGSMLDLCSDIWVACYYAQTGHRISSSLVAVFIVVPSLVASFTNLCWYYQDRSKRESDVAAADVMSKTSWLYRWPLIVLQLSAVCRYVDSIRYALKFRQLNLQQASGEPISYGALDEVYVRMLEEERDATLLRLIEGFLESAPQLLIQVNAFAHLLIEEPSKVTYWNQVPSIFLSAVSLAWVLVAHQRCLRYVRSDKNVMSYGGTALMFLWRFFTIASRCIAITWFCLTLEYYILAVLVPHYVVAMLWIFLFQHADFCDGNTYLEWLFNFSVGLVYIFVPFNLTEGPTRYRYLTAYTVEFIENIILLVVPLIVDAKFSFSINLVVLSVSMASFVLGIMFMLLYYHYLHPNGVRPIVCCQRVLSLESHDGAEMNAQSVQTKQNLGNGSDI